MLPRALRAVLAAVAALSGLAHAAPVTVCTVTVNSPDEAQAFRRALPPERYRVVELVEKGRADWLAAACRRGLRCDVLVISGHYDGEAMFYSDRVDGEAHLPVADLERAACSGACAGLLGHLAEVYLFGCHTLAAGPLTGAGTALPALPAARPAAARVLSARHGESSRDRMTRIFDGVPVLVGFPGSAPRGPQAGEALARWLRSGGAAEVGTGQPSPRLLAAFAGQGLTVVRGLARGDPRRADRDAVCAFEDPRRSPAERAAVVHALLASGPAALRVYLDHVEHFAAELGRADRREPALARALEAIAADAAARDRVLAWARVQDDAALRARVLALAHALGWIDRAALERGWAGLLAERLRRGPQPADVALACRLGADGGLASLRATLAADGGATVAAQAMLACAGDAAAREVVLQALVAARPADVEIARVLLRARPLADPAEVLALAQAVADMDGAPQAQAEALDALAQQPSIDAASAAYLANVFPFARSLGIQRALAGVLLRADLSALPAPDLARMLVDHRIQSPDGRDAIDLLIRRLAAPG